MIIRRAEEKDIERVTELLAQILEIHAHIRPDIFIHGTTKYTRNELARIFSDDMRPVYVAVNDSDYVVGYVFCIVRGQPISNSMLPSKSLFIDDLCIDEGERRKNIGGMLLEHVKKEAEIMGCTRITLNVWEDNISARSFYEKKGFFPRKTEMEYIINQ